MQRNKMWMSYWEKVASHMTKRRYELRVNLSERVANNKSELLDEHLEFIFSLWLRKHSVTPLSGFVLKNSSYFTPCSKTLLILPLPLVWRSTVQSFYAAQDSSLRCSLLHIARREILRSVPQTAAPPAQHVFCAPNQFGICLTGNSSDPEKFISVTWFD